MNYKETIAMMAAACVQGTRLDGGAYWKLLNEEYEDQLREMAYECHDGSFPSDQTYEMMVDVIYSLADADYDDIDEARDGCYELTDSLVDVYTTDLLAWLNLHTMKYVDEAIGEGISDYLMQLLSYAQDRHYQFIFCCVLDAVDNSILAAKSAVKPSPSLSLDQEWAKEMEKEDV